MYRRVKWGISVLLFVLVFMITVPVYAIYYVDENNKKVELDDFLDTKNHWAQELLRVWADYDIIKGGTDGKFRPNDVITRADIGVILDNLFSLKQGALNNFRDLDNNQYYTAALLRTYAAGFITGVDKDRLAPTSYATREQVFVMLARAFKMDVSDMRRTYFKDDASISSWARSSINAMVSEGYVKGIGNGMLQPKRNITRAEVMALIDSFITSYYTNIGRQSGTNRFSNNYTGNGFIGVSGVEIFRSGIYGNLFLNNNGSNGFKLVDSNVSGNVLLLGDRGDVTLTNSNVDKLVVYGKSTIKGVSGIKTIHLYKFASGTSLDGIPDRLILESGVLVTINNVNYENTSNGSKTYIGEDIKKDIASEKGFIEGGPKISFKDAVISFENDVTFNNCVLETSGNSDIKEVGVIYSRGKDVPSMESYDGKREYYDSVIEEFAMSPWRQYKNTEYTYRLYAVNKKGLIGYSKSVTFNSYDFDIEMKVIGIESGVRAEVHITGTNIPNIQRINCIHGTSSIYEEVRDFRSMSEDKTVTNSSVKGDEKRRYFVELKFSGTTPVSTYYGYDIVFGNAGEINEFPVLRNPRIITIKPTERLETGYATFSGYSYIYVRDNKLDTGFVEIQEIGVVKKEVFSGEFVGAPTAGENGWVEYVSGIRTEDKQSYTFDVYVGVVNQSKTIYYAVYVKTATGFYYGDVKSVNPYYGGQELSPIITKKPDVTVFSGDKTIVEVSYDSVESIDTKILGSIFSFRDSNEKAILPYDGGALRDAGVYLDRTDKKLILVFKDLVAGEVYTCKLRLFNKNGVSGIETITIDTSNVAPMSLSLREKNGLGDAISYYINHDYVLSIKKVTVDGSNVSVSFDNNIGKVYFQFTSVDESVTVVITFEYYISTFIDDIRSLQFNRVFVIPSEF